MSSTPEEPLASSAVTAMVLVPASVGWCTSLLICGIATDRTIALLRRSKQAGNAYARPLLIAAVTCNALGAVNVYASVISWMITQDRTEKALSGVKIPDVLYPLFSGLTGAIVQTYMVIRCWRVLNCRLWFIIVAGLAIAVALAGALWSVSATYALYHGADLLAVFIPGQIWFWTSAAVDVLITSCLIYLFTSMKRRASKPTDRYLNSLIQLSFETCLPPTFFQVASVALYSGFASSEHLWNTFVATSAIVPSLFVLSFVYCLEGTARTQFIAGNTLASISDGHGPAGAAEPAAINGRNLSRRRSLRELNESEISLEEGLTHSGSLGVTEAGTPKTKTSTLASPDMVQAMLPRLNRDVGEASTKAD